MQSLGMARKPRIEFPGALYHVIARGNQRRRTFLAPQDFEDYLSRLWRYHEKFHFILYAYCLMPNHVHLLIETKEVPLSKIMQAIQFSYTQSFNHRHKKVGHLFQGRYKAVLCEKDEYLLQLIRYIHLNPVRAKIANDPKKYPWSSHRALLGLEKFPRCDVDAALKEFGRKRKTAIKRYESFVLDAIGMGHKKEFYQWRDQRILGEEDFANEILSSEGTNDTFYYNVSIQEIVEAVAKKWDILPSEICSLRRNRLGSFGRGIVAYLAKTITGASMKEISKYFSKGESSMAHRFRIVEEMIQKDSQLKETIQHLYCTLSTNKRKRLK